MVRTKPVPRLASGRTAKSFCPTIILSLWGLTVGCGGEEGPPRLAISGKLTNAGQPLEVAGRDIGLGRVVVEFYPLDASGEPSLEPLETATVAANGEFNLVDGIPPGKYRIAVHQWDPYPQTDRLESRFDRESSPIVRDLTSETDSLEIDVSRPEG
jgi:hypothetical protein